MWNWAFIEQFFQDVRYAGRKNMLRNKTFTGLAVLSLAWDTGPTPRSSASWTRFCCRSLLYPILLACDVELAARPTPSLEVRKGHLPQCSA